MDSVVRGFLDQTGQALVIWAGLAGLALVAFAGLTLTARREWGGVARAGADWLTQRHTGLTRQRRELGRFSQELTVAADRASQTAQRRRDEWIAAQQVVESAWEAFLDADTRTRRLVHAAVLGVPRLPLTPAEVASREGHLHKIVTEAYNRGDLSVEHLLDALSGRNGWDPCRHPADQEVLVWRIARHRRQRAYRAAVEAEKRAWHDATVAAAARDSLGREAFVASAAVRRVAHELEGLPPRRGRLPLPAVAALLCQQALSVLRSA